MRRGPKPAKSKEAKPPVARKSPKNDDARVRDLEKRLAEALRDKAEALKLSRRGSSSRHATASWLRRRNSRRRRARSCGSSAARPPTCSRSSTRSSRSAPAPSSMAIPRGRQPLHGNELLTPHSPAQYDPWRLGSSHRARRGYPGVQLAHVTRVVKDREPPSVVEDTESDSGCRLNTAWSHALEAFAAGSPSRCYAARPCSA